MKILVSGSSGLIGSALVALLIENRHEVVRLARKKGVAGAAFWDPATGFIDAASLEGMDAVVHLAGENIAARRWTRAQKARILESRTAGTTLLAGALAKLARKPQVMVTASAIGYYGDRRDEILREHSPPGDGFLPEVCSQWEASADAAARSGIRVVHPRLGIVLARQGGALPKMVLPFRLGVGGKIGDGRQFMSWIALDDVARVFLYCMENSAMRGPVNAVAPVPVRNEEFTGIVGRVLHRPTLFRLPAFAARIVLGEMADELLLASARVEPAKLLTAGFRFRRENLEETLRQILLH